MKNKISRYLYLLSAIALSIYIFLTVSEQHVYSGWFLMLFFFFLASGPYNFTEAYV